MSLNWRKMPSLAALRAFEATASHGGFSGAARALNVTHAAVAQQVRALEKDLGLALATRNGRSVALTEAGARLALGLSRGFGTLAESVRELRESAARRGLRVMTTTFLTEAVIMPRLREFWERHPGVEIALYPTRDFATIARDGYDVCIRVQREAAPDPFPGMEVVHLFRPEVIAVATPDLAGDGTPAAELPWLWYDGNEIKIDFMRDAGLDPNSLRYFAIGSPNIQFEAARQGLGLTMVNRMYVEDDLAAGRLCIVPLPRQPVMDYVAVIDRGPRRALVDDFVEWLVSLFDGTGVRPAI